MKISIKIQKKLKKISSIILAIVILVPIFTKPLDEIFHKHFHKEHTSNENKFIDEYHPNCPIPGFELSVFDQKKQTKTSHKKIFLTEIKEIYNFIFCRNNLKFNFLLRAPPIF